MEQKRQTDLDQAMPDLANKFSPGELVADEGHGPEYLKSQYGNQLEELPEQYQEHLRKLCQKIAMRDMFANMERIRRATEQRFYWRGDFDTCWNEDANAWQSPGFGSPFGQQSDTGDVSLSYPLNIYQQKGREHISLISKIPGVRFEAKGLRPNAMKVASDANAMRVNIETINPMEQWVQDAARLSWTDSCVCFYQRWVTDGARYGYKEEHHDNEEQNGTGGGGEPPEKKPREPKGGECTTPYGDLETKFPINMRNKADFDFMQLSFEIAAGSAKSLYPWYAKKLEGGTSGPGEQTYARTCRLAVTQGVRTESGDTTADLPTWQRTWIRPSMFAEIDEEEDRKFFEDNFPDGAFVAFVGDVYCESRNESLDDHWEIWHPLPGDGQATPSCGEIILPVQDAVNDMADLLMERAMKGIPAIWCSKDAVDMQSLATKRAGPGAHYPIKSGLDPTIPVGNYFFPEPTPQGGEQEAALLASLFGDIPESLTGLSPAALGSDEENNPTFGGQKLRQDAAKGQSGLAWRSLRETYARIVYQLVRIGSYFRSADTDDEADGLLALSLPDKGEVYVDLEDLREGNFWCFADGDESYPRTHADVADAVQSLLAAATKNPALQPLIALPKNMVVFRDALGIPEMEIPGADIEEKQLGQIDRMLKEPPIPNMQTRQQFQLATVAAALTGQPAPQEPPFEALWNPIIKIKPEDDNTQMVTVLKNWLNSPEGCQQDEDNPDGTQHVRLLLAQRQKLAQGEQQQQQQQAMLPELILEKAKHSGQQRTPAESINYKDVGPSMRIQIAAQAGLDARGDEAANAAHETIEDSRPDAPPGGKPPGDSSSQ